VEAQQRLATTNQLLGHIRQQASVPVVLIVQKTANALFFSIVRQLNNAL